LEEKKRIHIWTAWMIFLTDLANLDRLTLENSSVYEVYDAEDESEKSLKLQALTLRQQSLMLLSPRDAGKYTRLHQGDPLSHVVTRSLFLSQTMAVQYDVDTTAIQFAGVQKVRLPDQRDGLIVPDLNANAGDTAPFGSVSDLPSKSSNDTGSGFEKNLSDILPLICFIDGWLEEIKNQDFLIPYQTNKTLVPTHFINYVLYILCMYLTCLSTICILICC
jgi:hypothetical protein